MTKAQALHSFFSGFGLTAYPATEVPDTATFPYLTYEIYTSSFGDGKVPIFANLFYLTDSEKTPNDKAQAISTAVGAGGSLLTCDGGAVWIKRSSPFCQSLADDTNPELKRRYLQFTAEFITQD